MIELQRRDPAADSLSTDLAPAQPSPQSQHYASAASATNTRRAYRADWADFTAWCAEARRDALPATPVTVADYLAARAAAKGSDRRWPSLPLAAASSPLPAPTSLSATLHPSTSGYARC